MGGCVGALQDRRSGKVLAAPGSTEEGKADSRRARGRLCRGGREHAAVPRSPAQLVVATATGGSLPLRRGRQCWAPRYAGRGGRAAGRGGDLWAFQASRCLLTPPIVSRAPQWGCCSRRAGPAAACTGTRSPGRRGPSVPPCAHRCVCLRVHSAPGGHPWARPAYRARGSPAPQRGTRGRP